MAIVNKTEQTESITEVWRALKLFTNRQKLIRLFICYLNEDPPREQILFFYGDGGNGKSLLLRYLREFYCKRFDSKSWEYLKTFNENEFISQVKESVENVQFAPFATVDFGLKRITSEDRPQEAFYGLLMLRRQLATHKIKFPLFDFACIWYLKKTNQLNDERLKNLFPAEAMNFVNEIIDVISGIPFGSFATVILDIFAKDFKTKKIIDWQKRGLDAKQIEQIEQMDAETDLMEHLPDFFALDLNAEMEQKGSPKRLVLFFDTHESFWGSQRNMPKATFFRQDEWLRRLLSQIEFSSGIVAVIAGRENPNREDKYRWADASRFDIKNEHIDAHLVGHLSPEDADEFLQSVGVNDIDLRQSLTKYAGVESGEVHPLYLGLCADIIFAVNQKGIVLTAEDFHQQPEWGKKEKELIDRFLLYVDRDSRNSVCALAACRAFNRELFVELGTKLNFYSTNAAFESLLSFSFVWQAEKRGKGWYKIHDLLRRLFAEHEKEKADAAHQVLENYYRERNKNGDNLAFAEAIYHANQLDWKRGVEEWKIIFRENLDLSNYQICRVLLEVRRVLLIKDDFWLGSVSQSEGNFYHSLYLYPEAIREYDEAIVAYDKFLLNTPDSFEALTNKGFVLKCKGNLEAILSSGEVALQSYDDAITTYDDALSLKRESAIAYNGKGLVLYSQGELEAMLSRNEKALSSFNDAIEVFNKALFLDSNFVYAYANKGDVLLRRGYLQGLLSLHEDALQSYDDAIKAFDKALALNPSSIHAFSGKGLVLLRRGDVETVLSRNETAFKSFEDAIDVFDKALLIAPESVELHNNRGYVFLRQGNLEVLLRRNSDALLSYDNALKSCNEAFLLAPNSVYVHNHLGIILRRRGDLETKLSRYSEALKSFNDSIEVFAKALSFASDYVYALSNIGLALIGQGKLKKKLKIYDEALQSFISAIEFTEKALLLAPNYVHANNTKGEALLSKGKLEIELSRSEAALQSYNDAYEAFNKALLVAPNSVEALNNKGFLFFNRGKLKKMLGQTLEACQDWDAALASTMRSLEIAPYNTTTQNLKKSILELLEKDCP